jgi:hypothetical protein
MPNRIFFRRGLSLFLTALALTNSAVAFDTAPHYDLTRTVLAERAFSDRAIKIAQVENWLTDYYSSSPTISKSKRAELEKLHFDNLYTTEEVGNYWARFVANVKNATRKAALESDEAALLATLAMSLHAVQDFYAHSNWVETHPRLSSDAYRTETFLSAPPGPGVRIFTGRYPADRKLAPNGGPVPAGTEIHGDYRSGLNHDSPVRAGWDAAYVFAYAASHELVEMIEKWSEEARPGFWKKTRDPAVSADDLAKLEFDLKAAQNLSMWIKVKGADGHWKGDKSGLARFFDTFTSKWVGKDSSVFARQMRDGKISGLLAEELYGQTGAPPLPKTGRFALRRRAVLVRTLLIGETDTGKFEPAIDPSGRADFYAIFTIGGQLYRERVIQDAKEAREPWFAIHFVDQQSASVPLKIAVFDEDDWDSGGKYKDDEIDINPASGKKGLELVFRMAGGALSGDVAGIYNTPDTAFTSTGAKPDKNRASFQCYISQALLK